MQRRSDIRSRALVLASLFAGCSSEAPIDATLPPRDTRPPRADTLVIVSDAAPDAPNDALPEEAWVVWASNREDGRHEIYLRRAVGGPIQRLTSQGALHPRWSPDGQLISYFHPTAHQARIMRPDGTSDRSVFAGVPLFWMHDGSGVVCATRDQYYGAEDNSFYLVDPRGGEPRLLFRKNDLELLNGEPNAGLLPGGITHDGRWLVGWVYGLFAEGRDVDNGSFKADHAAVIFDLADLSKVFFFGPGCSTATAPTGPFIYHVSREIATMPDIFRMRLDDRVSRTSYAVEVAHGDEDWGHEYMPVISNDNRWLIYAASTGCHDHLTCNYDIFIHRLGEPPAQRHRVTEHESNDSYPDLHIGPLP